MSIAVERTRLFARSTQLGVSEERNRLAREIHDTLAQGLTAVALKLETADALLESEGQPERVRQVVQEALALTQANLEEARRSVLDLRAAPLEGKTLVGALNELVVECARRGKLNVRFDHVDASRPLPARIEIGLYRIVQEALTNVQRHSHAAQASVQLIVMPRQIELTITDDGVGFDPEHEPEGHYGLVGMRERASKIGATIKFDSKVGTGTAVTVEWGNR